MYEHVHVRVHMLGAVRTLSVSKTATGCWLDIIRYSESLYMVLLTCTYMYTCTMYMYMYNTYIHMHYVCCMLCSQHLLPNLERLDLSYNSIRKIENLAVSTIIHTQLHVHVHLYSIP